MKTNKETAMGQAIGKTPGETEMNDFEVKGHLEDLMKAHAIMNDPAKMQKVHKLAGRHHKALKSIKDLKDIHQEKFGGKNATGSTLPEMTHISPLKKLKGPSEIENAAETKAEKGIEE